MAITITLIILAAALGSRMAVVNYWHRQELLNLIGQMNQLHLAKSLSDKGAIEFSNNDASLYGKKADDCRRRWHYWLGWSFWIVVASLVTVAAYDNVTWLWKAGDIAAYTALCWASFTVTINVKQGSKWNHVGSGNNTDDWIGKVAGWLHLKPTTINGLIIIALGLVAVGRIVFVYVKM